MKTKKRLEKLEELVQVSRKNLNVAVEEARKATRRAEAAVEAADEAKHDFKRVERLRTFMGGFFDYVARHPHFGRLTTIGSGPNQQYFENIITNFFQPLFSQGVRFVNDGIEEGVFREVNAEQFLLSVYAVAMGYFADAPLITALRQKDALDKSIIAQRRAQVLDMVCTTLGVDAAP